MQAYFTTFVKINLAKLFEKILVAFGVSKSISANIEYISILKYVKYKNSTHTTLCPLIICLLTKQ